MQPQNKRIVICCDGTWNKPDSQPTNVVKLVLGILPYTARALGGLLKTGRRILSGIGE